MTLFYFFCDDSLKIDVTKLSYDNKWIQRLPFLLADDCNVIHATKLPISKKWFLKMKNQLYARKQNQPPTKIFFSFTYLDPPKSTSNDKNVKCRMKSNWFKFNWKKLRHKRDKREWKNAWKIYCYRYFCLFVDFI